MKIFTLDFTTKNIDSTQQSFEDYYEFIADGKVNTVISNSSWCEGDVDYDNTSIEIDCEENNTSSARTAILTVRYSYVQGSSVQYGTETITINQAASGGSASTSKIILSNDSETVASTEVTNSISYTATNVTNLVANSNVDWITCTLGTSALTYTVSANTGGSSREGKITITGSDTDGNTITAQLTITQYGNGTTAYIKLTKNSESVSYEASESEFTYTTSNCEVTAATTTQDWITINSYSGGTVDYSYSANPNNQTRTGYVTLYGTSTIGGVDPVVIFSVVQAANTSASASTAYIEFTDGTEYNAPFMATTMNFNFTYSDTSNISASYPSWMSNPYFHFNKSTSTGLLKLDIARNTEYEERTGTIYVTVLDDNDLPYTVELHVTQGAYFDIVEKPIWKDTDIVYPYDGSYLDYTIEVGGVTIYSGRAYAVDGYVTLRTNDILRDYVISSVDLNVDKFQNTGGYIQANIMTGTKQIGLVNTYCNWTYDEDDDKKRVLNEPVSYNVDYRQLIPISIGAYDGESLLVSENYVKATVQQPSLLAAAATVSSIKKTAIVSAATTDTIYSQSITEGFYTDWCNAVNGTLSVQVKNDSSSLRTYTGSSTCHRWCVYYLNAYGGYDFLLVKGKQLEKKSITSNTFKRTSQNATLRHQTVNYQKDIKLQWDLGTDYLTDKASKILFKHLYDSPQIWLHDLENDKIYPVNMTTSSVDCKSFKNQGRKMFTHTFSVELSQERIRK